VVFYCQEISSKKKNSLEKVYLEKRIFKIKYILKKEEDFSIF